jgi:hypothetical protein
MTVAPFPTTRRSVVLALSSDDAAARTRAFDTLVALYWKPLYKYARVAGAARLQRDGWVESRIERSGERARTGRPATIYRLTEAGEHAYRTYKRPFFVRGRVLLGS